jgi:hypothetical protein
VLKASFEFSKDKGIKKFVIGIDVGKKKLDFRVKFPKKRMK